MFSIIPDMLEADTACGLSESEIEELEKDINVAMESVEIFYNIAEQLNSLTWGKDMIDPNIDTLITSKLSRLKDSVLLYATLYDETDAPELSLCAKLVDNEINMIFDMYIGGFMSRVLMLRFDKAISSLSWLMDKYIQKSKSKSKVFRKNRVKFDRVYKYHCINGLEVN